jgi:hypothetical protein
MNSENDQADRKPALAGQSSCPTHNAEQVTELRQTSAGLTTVTERH